MNDAQRAIQHEQNEKRRKYYNRIAYLAKFKTTKYLILKAYDTTSQRPHT
jgi:hypothetical protein